MTVGQRFAERPPVVLVIDDEDYVADMIASVLELEGMVMHVAYNGHEGLAQAERLSLDLLVIDIMMPYMSGIDLILHVRAHPPMQDLPVILISAGARPQEQLPHVTFVPKPFDMDELVELVVGTIRSGGRVV
ncbi:MAG: response regulator [Chloroflexota bacterium]|nr:response regulator [Chloroflexota bacterium]